MIIRRTRPEELRQYYEMRALTYHTAYVEERADDAGAPREEDAEAFRYAAFDGAGGPMVSGLAAIPYSVFFDGHVVKLMGVGGVATLPPYRRMGAVRGLMEAALPDMYASGAVFSYLFPFSTAFYRKFGYERCGAAHDYRLLIEHLPEHDFGGKCVLMQTGADFAEDVRRIGAAAAARYNFSAVPEEYELAWTRQYAPLQTRETAYLYYAADGTPKAYMALSRKRDAKGFLNIAASRIAFTDAEGFYALASLVRSFRADCRRWEFTLPAAFDLIPLLPETSLWTVECSVEQNGMVRVVNAMEALRLAKYIGSGEVALAISDGQIPQNNGTFRVAYQNGRALCVEKAACAPDAAMQISTFSRLIAGACALDALPAGDVTYHVPAETLLPVFHPKPCYMNEAF